MRSNQIDYRYLEIVDDELEYFEKIKNWNKLEYISVRLFLICSISIFFCIAVNIDEPYSKYIAATLFGAIFSMFLAIIKIEKIEENYGLNNEEIVFLEAYRAETNLVKYRTDTSSDKYREALEGNLVKIIEVSNNWNYGNLPITETLLGEQIELLKENLKNKPLGYINDKNINVLSHLIKILEKFLIYLLNPSIKQIEEINTMFGLHRYDKKPEPQFNLDSIKNFIQAIPNKKRLTFGTIFTGAYLVINMFIVKQENPIFSTVVMIFITSTAAAHYFVSIKHTNSNHL